MREAHFYPWEEICFFDFGRVRNFSAGDSEFARIQTQVLLVLTDRYLVVSKSVITISSSSAGKLIHYFFS